MPYKQTEKVCLRTQPGTIMLQSSEAFFACHCGTHGGTVKNPALRGCLQNSATGPLLALLRCSAQRMAQWDMNIREDYAAVPAHRTWGVPKIRGTFLGVPIIRIIIFGDPYWGPPILGNYHMSSRILQTAEGRSLSAADWPEFALIALRSRQKI